MSQYSAKLILSFHLFIMNSLTMVTFDWFSEFYFFDSWLIAVGILESILSLTMIFYFSRSVVLFLRDLVFIKFTLCSEDFFPWEFFSVCYSQEKKILTRFGHVVWVLYNSTFSLYFCASLSHDLLEIPHSKLLVWCCL